MNSLEPYSRRAVCERPTRISRTAIIAPCLRQSRSMIVAEVLRQLLLTESKQPLSFLVVSSQYLLNSVSLESITEALQTYNCTKERKS